MKKKVMKPRDIYFGLGERLREIYCINGFLDYITITNCNGATTELNIKEIKKLAKFLNQYVKWRSNEK